MQNHIFHPLLLILAAACLLCACQPVVPMQPAAAVTTPTVTPIASAAPVKQLTAVNLPTLVPSKIVEEKPVMNAVPVPTPLDAPLQAILSQVKDDLAKRLSIDSSQIELVEMSTVTWPDGSLGCPKPGMAYTQMLVDGMRIRVKAGSQVYEYHSGGSRPAFLCQE